MPKKRKSSRRKTKQTAGIAGSKIILVVVIGIIIMVGGFVAFNMMPGGRDAVTYESATEVIRDRGSAPGIPSTPSTPINETPIDEFILTNPIQMNLFGIDIDGIRHAVPESSPVVQSAYLGDVEIFDVEFDIYYNFMADITEHPDRYSGNVAVMIMLSLVDRGVEDTYGNAYVDSYESGAIYPTEFTYNHTILEADVVNGSSGFITLSLVNDLYGSFMFTDINDIDDAALVDAKSAGLMNQALVDNVTVDLAGMLTFEYGILGYYLVNEYGSATNRALKRLTVTTEPVAPAAEESEAGALSVYDIGGVGISDSAILVVGLGVFSMIVVYYYLNRRR